MRDAADAERIALLARELGRAVAPGTRMYLTGGGQVVPERLLELFEAIESELFRFPAVDPKSLRTAVESLASS